MTRVLLLSKHDRSGASSRVRSYQFLPYLARHGIRVEARPLLPAAYLERLYRDSRRSPLLVARGYWRRARTLRAARDFALLWIEKEALPWLPQLVERRLLPAQVPYVVDYDDAVFQRYEGSPRRLVRRLLGDKIDRVMRGAALVIAGSRHLAERARAAGASRIVELPSVVDPARYALRAPAGGRPFTVGWIGSPWSARYLPAIAPALAAFCRERRAVVALVGAGGVELPGVPTLRAPWSEADEAERIAEFDVGIMPLPDEPFERGKCGYKLIQYMAAGRPVVASPVGANCEIVTPDVGFLAAGPEQWLARLAELERSPALRSALGSAGRRRVEERYSAAAAAPRLRDALLEAARGERAPSA
jgi:glycosyltransferase involved in cell wall biosynthesis